MFGPYRTLAKPEVLGIDALLERLKKLKWQRGRKPLYLLLVAASGCFGCYPQDNCYSNGFANITNYGVNPDLVLSNGVRVDTGGYPINTAELVKRFTNIEDCIINIANNVEGYGDFFPPQEKTLKKDCIVVKIVDAIAGCSDWQFIDVLAPEELCEAKGVHPTQECPCRWRTALQDDNVVITPPDIYLWEVVRMHTGLDFIWDTPLAECAVM